MATNGTRKRRSAPAQQPTAAGQSSTMHNLLDCYDFLATNEYSEKTVGIQAFLTRKAVGDINYSDIIDDSEKRSRPGQQINFAGILEDKRDNLPEIDASVEKCLMLTRLIDYIRSNEAQFANLISDIRVDMQLRMTDEQLPPKPYDFAKRAEEFQRRKTAQEIRRLFYQTDDQLKNPKNLVYLQNRTTEHLQSLMAQIASGSKARQFHTEFETLFRNAFLIVAQPHSGVIPVIIYERKCPGQYTAKVSVIIISLLYDFMQLHPGVIELYDIEPSLCPVSEHYKLEEPRSLSWKTCQLQTGAGGRYRTFYYAELSFIMIEQFSKSDGRVRFAQLLHSLKFAIKLQFNSTDSKMPPIFQFPLESLVFGIGAHNNQTAQLLSRVIFEDIKRFSGNQLPDVGTVAYYLQRYFIHRTGVQPKECVSIYIEQELAKAKNRRSNSQFLEDIYLDFVVNFVLQVEFMAKHPVLAMFHADGLFLGICNSERAAEAIVQSWMSGSPVIGLRFNSIRIDYDAVAASGAVGRAVRCPHCAVRVDIYNDKAKNIQNRTFDSSVLATDISRFVCTAEKEKASRIRILSSFDDRGNTRTYLPLSTFANYFHKRLLRLVKDDEKYKPVTDLVENANDGNTEEDTSEQHEPPSSNFSSFSPSFSSPSPSQQGIMNDPDCSLGGNSVHAYASVGYPSPSPSIASPQHCLSPTGQQSQPEISYVNNQEAILKQLLSRPEIAEQVLRQYGNGNLSASLQSAQSVHQQNQTSYQPQPFSSQHPTPVQLLPQMSYQQPRFQQLQYPQQPPVQFQQTYMPFQQGNLPQQQLPVHYQQTVLPQQTQFVQSPPGQQQQQQQSSPAIIHYYPMHVQHSPTPSAPQIGMFPMMQNGDPNQTTPQYHDETHLATYSEGNLTQLNGPSSQQQTPDNESQMLFNDPNFIRILEDLKNIQTNDVSN